MNKEKVEFSIIIPTFNREKLLSEALKSANKGLPPNGELVIINDGLPFTSHFWSLTSELEGNVTATSGHLGAGAARNLGAELALGQWLFFLDDDDLIAKDYWCSVRQYIVQKLSTDTKAYGFCRSTSHSDRNQMKTLSTTNANFQIYPQEGSLLKAKLAGLGQGFWISKSLFQEIGGINPDLKTNEDTDLCLRLLGAGAKCHKSDGVGAFIFSGDRGRTAAQSTTKRYSPKQRAYYFKHIIALKLAQGCCDVPQLRSEGHFP